MLYIKKKDSEENKSREIDDFDGDPLEFKSLKMKLSCNPGNRESIKFHEALQDTD